MSAKEDLPEDEDGGSSGSYFALSEIDANTNHSNSSFYRIFTPSRSLPIGIYLVIVSKEIIKLSSTSCISVIV